MKKIVLPLLLTGAMIFGGCNNQANVTTIDKIDVNPYNGAPEIFVEPVTNIPDDFIIGCDVSSLIAEENSGVKYYNNDGVEQDLLLTLAENGINTIRIRIWNNPYDANGNGYGGGNNDINTAIEIGKRATLYNMKSMIDFHYSDFWADPAKQMVPKEWANMTFSEKEQALYNYTYDSMKKILNAGIDVSIVQIGNETTTGMCGEQSWDKITALMNSGSRAIRDINSEYSKDIKVAIHFTNPEYTESYDMYASYLKQYDVDYDIFASSYYPMWHGSLDNLTSVLKNVADTYDKKVMVAEFSYPYTYENGDTFGNSISKDSICETPYAPTIQGQADCIRDIAAAVTDIGSAGIGVCYWEPAWIPVPGNTYKEQSELWEKYGSGWASSYSAGYDPDDAGKYYGGSSWDNQSLFDFNGHPLPSLSTFRFLKSGANPNIKFNYVVNGDFENEDTSMWVITNVNNTTDECYIIDKESDAVSGSHSFHFYSGNSMGVDCTVEQTITGLESGTYQFHLTLHGGGCSTQNISIYAIADGKTYITPATITDWQKLTTPIIDEIYTSDGTVTIGAHIITSKGGWGNLDNFVLTQVE